MPTTKGLNFYLEDRNFQFVCESVMGPEVFERARPHLTALGEIAAASWTSWPPWRTATRPSSAPGTSGVAAWTRW